MNSLNKNVGIVMGYYDRQYQLNKTLETINQQKYDNLFVVIVDDGSNDDIILSKCDFDVKVIKISKEEKQWINPEPAYNRGYQYLIENTDSEIIIIQNAECYHVGNIIQYASMNTTINNYISFGCYSIDRYNTFNSLDFNVLDFINILGNDRIADGGMINGWYNHPIHRPTAFEFCSSIHRDNLIKLNGYDERLSFGNGFGDDYFLYRIKLSGLNVNITTKPIVVHQWHDYGYRGNNIVELRNKNRNLFQILKQENNIKAVHLFNKDLN